MGTAKPKVDSLAQRNREVLQKLDILEPGKPPLTYTAVFRKLTRFAGHLVWKHHLNSRTGEDLMSSLVELLLRMPDPVARAAATISRLKISNERWLVLKLFDVVHAILRKKGTVTYPDESRAIEEYEQFGSVSAFHYDDSIKVPTLPETTAIREDLYKAFLSSLDGHEDFQRLMVLLVDLDHPSDHTALAQALGMSPEGVKQLLQRFTYHYQTFYAKNR